MNTTTAQNITTVGVALLAVILAYIALSAHRYRTLGREALLSAAAFIFFQAIIRTLSINNVISPHTARLLVGISAFFALAIVAQVAWLKFIEERNRHDDDG